MLLVILGHTILGTSYSKLNKFIFSFNMPIFFLLSGYLYKERKVVVCIKNNFKKLIIPYFITSSAVIVGRGVMAYIYTANKFEVHYIMKNTMIGALFGYGVDNAKGFEGIWSIGAIWFLLAIFWSNIIFCIIMNIKSKQYIFYIIAILSFFAYILGQIIWLPTNIDIGIFAIIYMYIGNMAKKNNKLNKKNSILSNIIMILIWIVEIISDGVNMVIRYYPLYIISILGSVFGSYFIIKFCDNVIKNNNIKKFLSYIGKNSLTILCFHLFEMMIIPWDIITSLINIKNVLVIWQLKVILGVLFCLLINKLRINNNENKYLSKFHIC